VGFFRQQVQGAFDGVPEVKIQDFKMQLAGPVLE
jgi:hypothetical protein